MLRKADCRKMKNLYITDHIKALASRKSEGKDWYGNPYKGLYRFYLRAVIEGSMVKVSLFDAKWIAKGAKISRYDIFIDTAEVKYITLEKDIDGNEVKWRSAQLSYLLYEYYYSQKYESIVWSNIDTDKKLRRILKITDGKVTYKTTGESASVIQTYQSNILETRIKRKEQAECEAWDKDMKPIRKLPAGFNDWIRKNAIHNHFMFYKYQKKKITKGFCSCCGKMIDISGLKPKHNKRSRCPVCQSPIIFKSIGKISSLRSDSFEVQLVQPYKSGYVIRGFNGRMSYKKSQYWDPVISLYEYRRCIHEGDSRKIYSYSMYKNKRMQWMQVKENDYFDIEGTIYPKGLKVLPQYDLLEKAFKKRDNISLQKWGRTVIKDSIYEKLIKADFINLFSELFRNSRYYNEDLFVTGSSQLHKALQLDKMRMKRLKAMNGGIRELIWLQEEKAANTIWPDEMIKNFSDGGYEKYSFRFIADKMTYPQIFEYLKKQYIQNGYTWDYTISCWRDYLNMASKLNIPLDIERNYKPKDVRLAHNEALDMLQGKDIEMEAKKIDKKWKKLKKIYPKLKKYEYADNEYKVIAPESTGDIVREGMILKHCVHSCDFYFDRISTGESYILFLRKAKEPTVPYYTLEVEPGGNIRQKRTTGDRQNKDFEEAKAFLAKWQRSIQKKITKEDRALSKKSNELRIKELEELREKGSRVWHGVLQGQLLADVLEADFMPVITADEEIKGKVV